MSISHVMPPTFSKKAYPGETTPTDVLESRNNGLANAIREILDLQMAEDEELPFIPFNSIGDISNLPDGAPMISKGDKWVVIYTTCHIMEPMIVCAVSPDVYQNLTHVDDGNIIVHGFGIVEGNNPICLLTSAEQERLKIGPKYSNYLSGFSTFMRKVTSIVSTGEFSRFSNPNV